MNLDDIKNKIIRSAQEKLNRHRVMGARTKLSITEVAELLDIISGQAEDARVEPIDMIGNYSLN
ncbi:MAG: hypothetical protein HUJ25_04895 [Crocinitomicaceae bacterium]|nr:hypothetical protein [Crocinitomicaceae bacterium]